MTPRGLGWALATTLLAALVATPGASAGDGSAEYPSDGSAEYGAANPSPEPERRDRPTSDEDRAEGEPDPAPRPPEQDGGRPVLSSFSVSRSRLYHYGRAARVRFRIDDESKVVAVALHLRRPGESALVRAIDLGVRATGETHAYRLTGREGAALPEGPYRVRVFARDGHGKRLLSRPRASGVDELSFYRHRFPLRGSFSYGGDDARFGAKRSGHRHQGQDLIAPEGTPVLAPRGGIVTHVDFQASGAGHYVVIDGADEMDQYVFMHLEAGSIRVRQGQRVRTGVRIGNVGSTGRSSGPHLHFEIWRGPWYGGGEPYDPYPSLRRWDAWS